MHSGADPNCRSDKCVAVLQQGLTAARATGNRALAADAVQSATCAYLAAITLAGLGVNAIFHIRWVDSVAALVAVPLLIIEGRKAMHGKNCGCT